MEFEMKQKMALILIALMPVVGFVPTASATIITGPFSFFGPGTGTGVATTTTPGGSIGNSVVITENFTSYGTMRSSFLMPNNGEGSTQYLFTKTISNNTLDTWEDFKVAMACGAVGEGNPLVTDCAFFPLTVNYGVTPTNSEVGAVLDLTDPTIFHWSSMNVAPTESFDLTFVVSTCANCGGSWTIFETPSILAVPEPGSLALVSACLTLLTVSRKAIHRTKVTRVKA